MASMFSRRRGSTRDMRSPSVDRNTSSNATVAAASAFLQTSKSSSALSSAAAAAALRSATSSPEPVGSIQTKRMARRGSNSSAGSDGSGRPGLRRANSSGSMTERTFRSPSPSQSGRTMSLTTLPSPSSPLTSNGQSKRHMSLTNSASTIPPVPAIPANLHARSQTLDPPQHVASPPSQGGPKMPRANRASMPPSGTIQPAKRQSNVADTEDAEKARNFSRPMSPSQNSPVTTGAAKKYTHNTGSWFTQASTTDTPPRPKTSDGMPSYKPAVQPLQIPLPAGKPAARDRISSGPGSHLSKANQNQSRSYTPSVSSEAEEPVMVYDSNSRTFIQRPRQRVQPPSPESPRTAEVYDPNTRSFVPRSGASKSGSRAVSASPEPRAAIAAVQTPQATRPSPVNTKIQAPARNAARGTSPGSGSPSSPRGLGALHKQPSVVREDYEAELQAEASSPLQSQPKATTWTTEAATLPSKGYIAAAPTTPHQRSTSLDVPRLLDNASRGRNSSASPNRSAHFSRSPVREPERHVPPPRDLSPAKSALKQSPASSVRASSPVTTFSSLGLLNATMSPPSETSEDTSSQDGLGSGKRKKTVRVSFDDPPREVDSFAESSTPKATDTAQDEDDDVGMMKARPALPSFGSVRKNRVQPDPAEKVTEMPPERHEISSDHAIGGILKTSLDPLPPEVTSREIADYASDTSSEVEVEVPAVISAATPEPAQAGAGLEGSAEIGEPQVKDFAEAVPSIRQNGPGGVENADVPDITLLPPTPGVGSESPKELGEPDEEFTAPPKPRSSMEVVVPGGWNLDDESEDKISTDDRISQPVPVAAEPVMVEQESIREIPTTEQAVESLQSPEIYASPLPLSDIDESSDDAAEFSDAVEDPSDLDDGGFASLDAIVESPVVSPSPAEPKPKIWATVPREPPESPSPKPVEKKVSGDELHQTEWQKAAAYWSQLSKDQRTQIERQHLSSDDEARPPPVPAPAKKLLKPKKQAPAGAIIGTKTSKVAAPRSKQAPSATAQTTAQPALRKTMRAQPEPTPVDSSAHMRSSMRAGGSGMASTLRQGPPPKRTQSAYVEPKGTLQKRSLRPMSSSGIGAMPAAATVVSEQPLASQGRKSQDSSYPTLPSTRSQPQKAPQTPQVSARLQRELAPVDESDSESSFRKRRRGASISTVESQGKYSMRRSMRGGPVDPAPPLPRPVAQRPPMSPVTAGTSKGGFKFRSLSPQGGLFGRSRSGEIPQTTGPRTTLRGPPAGKSASKTSGKPSTMSTPAPASRFKSRLADSDDEDEDERPKRSVYRSRFADSDDDEPTSPTVVPADLAPVRGIPRRRDQNDGDSTDLEDEDDEDPRKASKKREKMQVPLVPDPADVEKAMAAAKRNLGVTDSPKAATKEGSALAKGSLRARPEQTKTDERPRAEEVPSSPPEKKRGFMNSILRRNRNSTASVQQMGPASPALAPTSPKIATPVTQPPTMQNEPPSSSSASINRLVHRDSDQPKMVRGNSELSITATPQSTSTSSPSATRKEADNWPLASPKDTPDTSQSPVDKEWPSTSDGFSPEAIRLARTMRPDLAANRSQSGLQSGHRVRIQAGEEGSEPGERDAKAVYSRRTGKKKKFGMLRRAFGIDD